MSKHSFPAGSMGPKVDAACRFARATGHSAAIGALADVPAIVRGEKGTIISQKFEGTTWHG
jgi:carbamate kinase